ncbi:YhbP family protein [Cronobacter dublinensis]|uniref:YhbP family protein n=1 Tax=Cronobacter dublinensis TaxID=413497 RepID=UPI001375FC7B|nr:YhbP family protein [Cronobacter dublinensis]EKK7715268.1 YhbP family protein [Cronobacter dublinensis]EKY3089765.1 YhbP family protein [Cronobacter dublinensis]ELQ6230420.1 YhbP family protein [Cronobacter dublinensis]ELY3772344.1 YhbP family protein [Cronobacter dublinensis]ELY4006331.1 YhbP family protein [Cronobacter dublinensis]
MDALDAISQWLAKQHVVTYCVGREDALWCANAFYVYDRERVAFYLLSDTKSRHGEMAGRQARVAGTVNGQTKTVARIRGVQFAGELRLVEAPESEALRERYNRRFPVARVMSSPLWEIRLDEIKFTDNTLGFGKKLAWLRAEQA